MKSKKEKGDLRTRAEALVAGTSSGAPADTRTYSEVLHELLVYQIELEMQNEELRKAQDVIEDSRTRYADLYDFAPVAYLTFDKNGRVTEANLTACGLLDVDRRSLIGTFFSRFVTRADQDTFLKHRLDVLKKGMKQTCELAIERDGARLYVSMESIEADNAQGPTIRSAITDISERREAEREHDALEQQVRESAAEVQRSYEKLIKETEERERIEAQLRQSQKMEALGVMSGGIAHDFNNLLAAIIGFTELAKDRLPQENREVHLLGRVIEAGLRGRELVRQMLTFSRKAQQDKKPLLLSSMIKETTRLLRASIPSSIGIRVDVKNASGMVLADPVQIQQVLINLCTNAAYAMREKGGVIDIALSDHIESGSDGPGATEPGPYAKLSVRDTGIGIAPEHMDKIFDPFFTTKGPGEGSGLGLSVVQGIVKQSGGYITVTSGPGSGAIFSVYLPAIAEVPAIEAEHGDAIPTGSERILFVDDETTLTEIGEELLAELGYEVVARTSSREALALFRLDRSRFDLLVTDQTMPEMTGIELAREVLALRPEMPVVMCTGFSDLVDADIARAAGVKAFAMKPLTKREIAKTIRTALDE